MHKLYICAMSLLWVVPTFATDYTWICEADYTVNGVPDASALESLSKEINQELETRKEQRIKQTCTNDDFETYTYDVRYLKKRTKVQKTTYEDFLTSLKENERLERQKITRKNPIILSRRIHELDLKSFSCVFSCQPPQDLSHIR